MLCGRGGNHWLRSERGCDGRGTGGRRGRSGSRQGRCKVNVQYIVLYGTGIDGFDGFDRRSPWSAMKGLTERVLDGVDFSSIPVHSSQPSMSKDGNSLYHLLGLGIPYNFDTSTNVHGKAAHISDTSRRNEYIEIIIREPRSWRGVITNT